jgi:hypothetical protein
LLVDHEAIFALSISITGPQGILENAVLRDKRISLTIKKKTIFSKNFFPSHLQKPEYIVLNPLVHHPETLIQT